MPALPRFEAFIVPGVSRFEADVIFEPPSSIVAGECYTCLRCPRICWIFA